MELKNLTCKNCQWAVQCSNSWGCDRTQLKPVNGSDWCPNWSQRTDTALQDASIELHLLANLQLRP